MGSAQSRTGDPGCPEFEIEINDCSLVSIPEKGVEALSMFDPGDAIITVLGWTRSEPTQDKKNLTTTYTLTSQSPLLVKADKGQWKISGYLSVNLTVNGENMNRLYYFDPEGTTGAGGGWGPD